MTGRQRPASAVLPAGLLGSAAFDAGWRTFLLLALGASWGLQFALLKIASDASLGELGILTLCMVLLAAAYLAVMAIRKDWFRPTRRHIRFFAISGLFGFVVPLGGVLLVADRLSAGLIVLYSEALIPVFTVAIALTLRTERLTPRRLGAVLLALLGVAVALRPELVPPADGRPEGLLPEGLMIVLIIPLAYAIDGIYVAARWPDDLRAFQVVTGEAIAGAVMLLPLWCLFGGFPGLPDSFGAGEWAILAFVPVSFLEVFVYFYLLKTAGAVFVSFGSVVSLFAGFFWGITLLGEQPRPSVWIAIGLVSLGLYLITVKVRPSEPATANAN